MSGSASLTERVGTLTFTNDNSKASGVIDANRLAHHDASTFSVRPTSAPLSRLTPSDPQRRLHHEPADPQRPDPSTTALLNYRQHLGHRSPSTAMPASASPPAGLSVPASSPIPASAAQPDQGRARAAIFQPPWREHLPWQTVINGILTIRDLSPCCATFGTPQNGTPRAATIVNFNSTINEAGTLQPNSPASWRATTRPILRTPLPFNPIPTVVGFQVSTTSRSSRPALTNMRPQPHRQQHLERRRHPGGPRPTTATSRGRRGDRATVSGVAATTRAGSGRHRRPAQDPPGKLIFDNANTYRGKPRRVRHMIVRDCAASAAPAVPARSPSCPARPSMARPRQ